MFCLTTLRTSAMQPHFWQYFITLFIDVPPELKRFVASLIGGAIGLLFFPPHDWRSGFSQVLISYAVSHYASNAIIRWKDIDAEFVRFVLGFGGIALVRGAAKLFKRMEGNPERTLGLLDKLIDTYQKWKTPLPPDDHEQQQ